MEKADLKRLGFRCGIEIHQQLEGRKLFCSCPTTLRDDEPQFTVKRRLRAVVGETGKVDIAAREETEKGKYYVYEGYYDTNCLVELDEMPPNPINSEAFSTALQVCKMLKGDFVDGAQVMRKTVVDGSNTSGFQRTALIARNGILETSEGKIRIPTIIIEEDACRPIKNEKDHVVFRLDRLGIPLMEIATEPDIISPEHCKETAEKLGMLLRSTGKAKRGIGTIRQDVNVSIKEGNRVEIKGAQDLKSIPTLIENEIKRQVNLVDIYKELHKRRVKKFDNKAVDLSKLLKNSGAKLITKTLQAGNTVMGIKLNGFAGLIGRETLPKKRLGTEFSERAKVIAGVGGIIHSDELPAYGITDREVDILRKELLCKEQDGFAIVADEKERCLKALVAVNERANQAIDGVPMEVRKANPDNTTSYERQMPGAARMYPETDIPPIKITKKMISSIKLPELITDKAPRYEKMGLGKDLAILTAKSPKAVLFEKLVVKHKKIKAAYIAEIVMTADKIVKRQFKIDINPTEEDYELLFDELSADKISKENVLDILKENKPVSAVIEKYHMMSDKELEAELKKIVSANKGLQFNALIGEAMKKLRGKAAGKKISEMLRKMAS
ncbi:Glu-tRNA(Gln) amidotransferase subunit GatE [Candidatus Woesearchaeota archaeon]|nr:Glu-tRNA(Gln) amidotransferase subunit GatE [Candidatus Woesearchaeota archaeon]MBW3006130.1 Glu-tRNA(Gln) amidotransferase subunit GatE [Candidatus Woesearchaeota archaeon]